MSETLESRPEEAPALTAEEGVGQALAQARRAVGLSLDDVAQQLKYGARQIEALERGRFESLHGATFARGMVRSYARLLKLDPEPLLERIADRGARPDALGTTLSSRRPIPFSDRSRRSNVTYVVLSLVTLAVGAVVAFEWHLERSAQRSRSAFVAAREVPAEPPARARVSAAVPGAAPRAPAAVAPSAISSGGSPAAGSEPAAAPEGESAPQPPAVEPAQPAAGPAAAVPASSLAGASAGQPAAAAEPPLHRITLSFREESWVEVKDASGKKLLSQLNPPGTRQVVEGKAPLSLVIGNAQHVQLTYDGQPIDLAPYTKVEVARLTLD